VFSTRDLAIYGALVGTLAGAWALYVGIVLDRARIRLKVWEGHAVETIPDGTTRRFSLFACQTADAAARQSKPSAAL
jgi:hypothetical protein